MKFSLAIGDSKSYAWHIRRNTSKQVGYALNGPTLVFTEIWSPAAAAPLDLNLAVVPLHEEYKPFVTNYNGCNHVSMLG